MGSAQKSALEEIGGSSFDYIIVGGGTAGCLLASRLAAAPVEPRHRVLLIEAGGEVDEQPDDLAPGLITSRYGNPASNWPCMTVPQKQLNNRQLFYPRGLGLGGSSCVNFFCWHRAPRCDWDEWARLAGDDWWKWNNVVQYMKRLEDFSAKCPPGMEKFYTPTAGMHQTGGPIGVGGGEVWQPLIKHLIQGCLESGLPLNQDMNDGDPNGVSISQSDVTRGERHNSAVAFLSRAARKNIDNLVIVSRTLCKRVLFEGKRAVGVELIPTKPDGDSRDIPSKVPATKEIILTAGSFETPHVLLLSGIGPSAELSKHGIAQVVESPGVGRNMQDHTSIPIELTCDPSIPGWNQVIRNPEALAAARKEYETSKTGPLSIYGASAAVVFTKLPGLFESREFNSLPPERQSYLQTPDRPSTEVYLHGGPVFYQGPTDPSDSVIATLTFPQNLVSRGSVTLSSNNIRDLPNIDPAYLTEDIDWRTCIESVKLQLRLLKSPAISAISRQPLYGPGTQDANGNLTLCSEDDEEAIREHIREHMDHGYHAMGTCVMGDESVKDRVVDPQLRVLGVEGLRVADMSVCPMLTNNHTQINAYLIGERAAQCILGDDGKAAYASMRAV